MSSQEEALSRRNSQENSDLEAPNDVELHKIRQWRNIKEGEAPLFFLCPKCNEMKSEGEYYKNKKRYSGRDSHCKKCVIKRKLDLKKRKKNERRIFREFESRVAGEPSPRTIESFASVFSRAIQDLLDDGRL